MGIYDVIVKACKFLLIQHFKKELTFWKAHSSNIFYDPYNRPADGGTVIMTKQQFYVISKPIQRKTN